MPSVDDVLRGAFDLSDETWVLGAESAHRAVRARHRRQVITRTVAGVACAAALVAAATLTADPDTRTVAPADPPTTSTSTPAVTAGPLEGTWVSTPLDEQDVRAAARRTGASGAARAMLKDLPGAPFEVVMVVQGSSLRTSVRRQGSSDLVVLDQETLSTAGRTVEVRPFNVAAATLHRWTIKSGVLRMSFRSTSEPLVDGVPGEAWQRLLYDSAPLARRDVQ